MGVVIASPASIEAAASFAWVGSEAPGLPATNLLDLQPRHPWYAPDEGSAAFVINLGSALAMRVLWLGYITDGGTGAAGADVQIQWRADASSSTLINTPAAAAYNAGVVDLWPQAGLASRPFVHSIVYLPAAQTYQFWRCDITELASGAGFRAGVLVMDAGLPLSRKIDWGAGADIEEYAGGDRKLLGGARIPRRGARARVHTGTVSHLLGDEWDELEALYYARGRSQSVLMLDDPEAPTRQAARMHYGTFRRCRGTGIPKTTPPKYRVDIEVEELPI
jgi:hypothetical protein